MLGSMLSRVQEARANIMNIDQALFLDRGFTVGGRFYPYISGGSEGEGDSGSGDGDGTGTDNSGGTSGGTGDGEGDGGQGSGEDEKKFSQKELNDHIAREVSKAQRGKLDPKELGFESAKELKEFLDKQKEAMEEAKTQAEKDLEEAKTKAADEAKSTVLAQATERLILAEFKIAANAAGVVAPDDAYVLAKTMDIWTQVEVDEDKNEVSGFDNHFFDSLKEKKPYLFGDAKQNGSGDIGAGAGGGGGGGGDRTAELKEKYKALPR